MTYAEKLKDPRWQKKRLEIMSRDKFTCRSCGDSSKTLNVHHCYYTKGAMPWDYPDSALVTYCERCHKIIEWRISHMNREIHGGGSRQHKFLRLLNADLCDGPFAPPCFAHFIDRIDDFLHNYEDAITDDDGSDLQIRRIKELKRRASDISRVLNNIVEFTEEACAEPPDIDVELTKPRRKRRSSK
jgi:Mg2+ and Co2+ transporter CorA